VWSITIATCAGRFICCWFTRQLCFEFNGKRYKARYNRKLKPRGGIEIVEVSATPGQPERGVARAITNLKEAAKFFRSPKAIFKLPRKPGA